MKITGKLEHSDLEGGVWVFQSSDGNRYHLEGLPGSLEKPGAHLQLEGEVDKGAFSIGMMGSVFRVSKASLL